jgi:DNA-binding LacI/PurR family transcriptional regulator
LVVSTAEQTYEAIHRLARTIPGLKLPGERELSERYGVGRQHIRRVLTRLADEGLVERRQGSGTYAASERTQTIRRVGLWVDRRLRLGDDPFFTLMIERLLQACHDDHVHCTVERVDVTNPPRAHEDGILTLGLAAAELLPRLGQGHPPAVALFVDMALNTDRNTSLLQLDDVGAGRSASEWLIASGCDRLVFVGRNHLPVSQARLTGARSAANEAGIPLEVVEARMNYQGGITVGSALELAQTNRLGVFCANDWLALGVHAGLSARSPGERAKVLLASVDGLPFVADARVGIRSLRAPLETIAVDALTELRRLSGFPPVAGRVIRYPLAWVND